MPNLHPNQLFCKLQWLPDFSYLHYTMSVLAALQSFSGGTWRVFNQAGHAECHFRHCLSAAHMLALPAATFVGRLIAGALLAMSMLQVLHEGELRLMTIAQLVNGTRESALLRVARLAKQFAQVTIVLAICPLWRLFRKPGVASRLQSHIAVTVVACLQ